MIASLLMTSAISSCVLASAPADQAIAEAGTPKAGETGTSGDPVPTGTALLTEAPSDFWLAATPYVWAASVDATVSSKGISSSFDASFSDILRNLDLAFMIHVEAGYRRAFLFGDYEYMSLGVTNTIDQPLFTRADVPKLLSSIQANDPTFGSGPLAQALAQAQGDLSAVQAELQAVGSEVRNALAQLTPRQRAIIAGLAKNRVDGRIGDAIESAQLRFAEKELQVQAAILAALAALSPGPELDYIEADMTLQIAEFGGGYRVLDWELGRPAGEQRIFAGLDQPFPAATSRAYPVLGFDLLAGVRYYNMQYDQTIAFSPDKFGILPSIVEVDDRYEWVDAIIGGRISLSFGSEWRIFCRGDAGGFTSENNSWNVLGGVEWSPINWFSVVAGYRALGIEYVDDGGFGFDGVLQGPFLGATFTF